MPSDVLRIAEIVVSAFDNDAHTQMTIEARGRSAYQNDMAQGMQGWMASPRSIVMKATDDRDQTIVGFCAWGFDGVPIPDSEDGSTPQLDSETSEEAAEDTQAPKNECVKRLAELETATTKHLLDFMTKVKANGSKRIYIISIAVDPRFQDQGVGSSLVKWGTDVADKAGAFSWVHSSEGGWRFYEKHGFEEVDRLTVDLDDWAVRSSEKQKRWGEYTWRYGVRECAV
ncbi:hypothetical protein LTR56_011411 [Elasticomyces elasticus]|nr:hypothetical protein LTR56_011411 [Elasticomyces elasticus]KAK3655995.1 hypothetical protein LTR22_010004 [Elasticomyces elasticus]KAK4921494.1 hypothetical protein LTR49_011148 [Elasticomyces elasticus]KAK5760035.1 hypothetical protein LTS12_009766 [Elasticomyces elasticus]